MQTFFKQLTGLIQLGVSGLKTFVKWEVVMAQFVEQSFPIPEVCGLNPVIHKNLCRTFTVNCIEKTKIKKRGQEWPIFKKKICNFPQNNFTVC